MRADWVECKLNDIADFINGDRGKDYPSRAHYVTSGIPFISAGNILESNTLDTNNLNYISDERYSLLRSGLLKKGDIVYCIRGSLGKYAVFNLDSNGAIASSLVIVRNKSINLGFLYYYLGSDFVKHQIKLFDNGTAQPNLSAKDFSNFKIPLPPLPEQRAIVKKIDALFSSLDAGIADLKKAQNQLKIYRQAVLKKAFEGELTNTKGINYVELNELVDSVEYGSSAKSKEIGDIPVLRMGNIQKGLFDYSDLVYTSDISEIERYKLQKYDVLFNRTNSPELVGKTAIYKGERDAIFAGYLIRINYKKDLLNPFYLNYYLNSHEAKVYGNSVKSDGVNQSNINGTKLKGYPIPYTTLEHQAQIVKEIEARLSVCDAVAQQIKDSLNQAEALRQSILKKAFVGKLLTEDEIKACQLEADYEPASVLLEKIKAEKEANKTRKQTKEK